MIWWCTPPVYLEFVLQKKQVFLENLTEFMFDSDWKLNVMDAGGIY